MPAAAKREGRDIRCAQPDGKACEGLSMVPVLPGAWDVARIVVYVILAHDRCVIVASE